MLEIVVCLTVILKGFMIMPKSLLGIEVCMVKICFILGQSMIQEQL